MTSGGRLRAALASLERRWSDLGIPLGRRLAPGSTADVVADRLEDVGLASSEELITWFGWHDGRATQVADIGPVMVPLSLDDAIARRRDELGLAAELADAFDPPREPPLAWDPRWLPLVDFVHGGSFVAVCDANAGTVSPVWRYEHDAPRGRQVAASLAELVEGWIALIDGGHWRWDANSGQWATPPSGSAPPPEEERSFTA